jgi:alanyl-tRNA synthetase
MPSERLYYTDAYLIEFDAVVREVEKQGERWSVTLDRTAFYPTSGGQPFDTGTLDEARVLDVVEQPDGSVSHIVDRELEKNSRVRGHIDWARRFDHMQQHTGQHLLSAAFEHEAGARTVSFHLGSSSSTIDLDKELSADEVARVEAAANERLWQDQEVCVKFVSESEAAKLPLRKESARTGELRIIEIPDYDLSACGGTHVQRTGAIGVITVSGIERFKGGLRVEFLCGGRALSGYHALKRSVDSTVRLLSVLPGEIPAGVEKLQAAARQQQKAQEGLQERLAVHEAAALQASGEQIGGAKVVAAAVSGWDAAGLKKLASAIVSKPGTIAVLLTTETPSLVAVARSQDLTVDAGAVLKPLLDRFGGKGGGKGAVAQAGGLSGEAGAILAAAKDHVRSLGSPTA